MLSFYVVPCDKLSLLPASFGHHVKFIVSSNRVWIINKEEPERRAKARETMPSGPRAVVGFLERGQPAPSPPARRSGGALSWESAEQISLTLHSKDNIAQQETKQLFVSSRKYLFPSQIASAIDSVNQIFYECDSSDIPAYVVRFSGLIVTRGTVSTCEPFFDIR